MAPCCSLLLAVGHFAVAITRLTLMGEVYVAIVTTSFMSLLGNDKSLGKEVDW